MQIKLLCLIWRLWMSPFISCMIACSAWRGYRVMDQNAEGCWLRREHLKQKHERKQQYWRDNKTGVGSALRLSLGCLLELGKLSYLIWKRTSKGIYWNRNLDMWPTDRCFIAIFWVLAGVCQPSSTFWSVTLQPVGADQATIWQIKGGIPGFHRRHIRLICQKRLQS